MSRIWQGADGMSMRGSVGLFLRMRAGSLPAPPMTAGLRVVQDKVQHTW